MRPMRITRSSSASEAAQKSPMQTELSSKLGWKTGVSMRHWGARRGSGQKIADANRAVREMGREAGGEHAAGGGAPRIPKREFDLEKRVVAFKKGAAGGKIEPTNKLLKAIQLGRLSRRSNHTNQ